MKTAAPGKKILIVDDEQDLVAVLALRLSALGYAMDTAHTGRAGMDKLKQARPDVVLLDLRMPGGMSGWDFCEELKRSEETRHIPILILTAEQTLTMDEKLGLSGAAGVLQKPFELEDLEKRLAALLGPAQQ